MIDGSIVKAHQHAAGAVGGQYKQALGRSVGGFSTKIHAKVDALGLPLKFILTGGQEHEINQAAALVDDNICDYLLADRAYDCNDFRKKLQDNSITAVIPSKKNRLSKIQHDTHIYKERNLIERLFHKLKNFRRIATRYDKTSAMYMGALTVASILLWLK